MLLSNRVSGLAIRLSLIAAAVFAFAGSPASANAQTAPQLLPYTSRLIAGGGTTTLVYPGNCPVSGYTMLDKYGDGCLATEIQLGSTTAGSGPRYAVVDKTGAVFFGDYSNGLIRRVDPVTGIVTAVAGGATTSPASGTACGTGLSSDAKGDGCPANDVHLDEPTGLVFSPAGNLYFGEYGYSDVREIAAVGGIIPVPTLTTPAGTISLVAGSAASTYGYASNNSTTTINSATQGYLDAPFGLAFDTAGNLYIAEEYKEAILVVNTNATGSTTVANVSIPAGSIAKIVGASTTGGATCPNSPASTNGCNYGTYTSGALANASEADAPFGVTFDPSGNVYFADEYDNNVGLVNPSTGILTSYAGKYPLTGTGAKVLQRAQAGTFAIGSNFGLAADANDNLYITDALNGVVWRVDGAGQSMYVVAGGATSTCSGATDTYGDGCPATQATFGSSGSTYTASGITANVGIFGVTVDAYSDLFVGDTITDLIREVASGSQFGVVGAGQPTDVLDIHFAQGDSPAASAYTLTAGASNFSLGTATCTANSDTTVDCLLPVTATPTTLGAFSGTLQVTSTKGGVGTFPLTGTYAQSPTTRTAVSFAPATASSCSGSTTYATNASIVLTATLTANGPSAPGGTITFFANGTALGAAQNVTNIGTVSAPVYGATLAHTFTTAGAYTITATYSGDSYFTTSSGKAAGTITSSTATFTTAALASNEQSTVAAGQTALYSFNVAQSVYTGTISFTASGLPAGASASFSPQSIAATGCSGSSVVALSILTQQATIVQSALGAGGSGWWSGFGLFAAFGMALLLGLRRRKLSLRYGRLLMAVAMLLAVSGIVACGSGAPRLAATPSGTYTVTVTATGSAGTTTTFTVPLTVK